MREPSKAVKSLQIKNDFSSKNEEDIYKRSVSYQFKNILQCSINSKLRFEITLRKLLQESPYSVIKKK
jgi:hypothetical protein